MMGFKAALFDLDGTMIYSKGVIGKCINDTLNHFELPPFEKKEMHELVGVPLGRALALKTPNWKPLITHYRKLYLSRFMNGTRVYEGMIPILDMLKRDQKKVGVVTLKSTFVAQEVIKRLELDDYIDAVCGDDDVSELKPSPDHIHRVCRALDVKSQEGIVIGDTVMDITAGRKANCKTIGVLWGAMSMDVLSEAGADFLVRSPEELKAVLEKI